MVKDNITGGMSFAEEMDATSDPRRAKVSGILLQELVKGDRGVEFTVEVMKYEDDKPEDLSVDTAFSCDEYVNQLNMDCLRLEDEDDDGNSSPFEILSAKMIDLTSDGAIKKLVKKKGVGELIGEKSLVSLHYNMYLELEEVPFDSSYLRLFKEPFKLQLGEGSVIPGFEMAVASMHVGEKSQFLIESQYAFGMMGIPPRIPPDATILLEVEVVNCLVSEAAAVLLSQTSRENLKVFKNAFKQAKAHHLKANSFFQCNNYKAAVELYRKAVDMLLECVLNSDEEEEAMKSLLIKLYRNLCVCYNKLNIPQKVCIAAKDALLVVPEKANRDSKIHFHWGKALAKLSGYSRAAEHLKKAQSLDPNCQAITAELVALEEQRKQELKHEKITYKRALGLDNTDTDGITAKPRAVKSMQEGCDVLVKGLENFSESNRSRMELPSSLTKEEKEVVQETAVRLGLEYKEIKAGSEEYIIAVSK